MRWPFRKLHRGRRGAAQHQSHDANVRRELRDLPFDGFSDYPAAPHYGAYNGHPVEYIGPARFPDCRRPTCMRTSPHRPGEGCIG